MSTMEHCVVHGMPHAAATSLTRQAVDDYVHRLAKYTPTAVWNSEHDVMVTFTAKGLRLSGSIRVEPEQLRLRLEVPFLLRPFVKPALAKIDEEVHRWLHKANTEFA